MKKEAALATVQIDEHNLDQECVALPTQYINAAFESAENKRDVGELSNELKVIEAELRKEITANPEEFGLDKTTRDTVDACVTSHAKYKKATEALGEAQHRYEMSQALVWAMEHKKKALVLLVDLHGMSYFSKPKVGDKGKAAVLSEHVVRGKRNRRGEDEE